MIPILNFEDSIMSHPVLEVVWVVWSVAILINRKSRTTQESQKNEDVAGSAALSVSLLLIIDDGNI